ncbi:hypothetical protein VP01_523g9 [Puccinia sorghi]|uniref:Uncharacterized protein n=1 Tax=Puccinia sorghi TaxID=27349 RepID=A0A0L6UKJ9_9BASI|nr:hypothetical protein VP01_523g9 [Puccinia sorghi]
MPSELSQGAGLIAFCKKLIILDYLLYLKLENKNKVKNILTTNRITSHNIFKSNFLSHKDVMALGLSLGVVIFLFDHVHCFEKQVA